MDRVFLDANVLFSSSHRADSGLRRLWSLPATRLLISSYALEEAQRNCVDAGHRERLESLLAALETVEDPPLDPDLPELGELPGSDRPILQAAVSAGAGYLLSGDRRAFGAFYGQSVGGVRILKPAAYLRLREGETAEENDPNGAGTGARAEGATIRSPRPTPTTHD